MTQNKMTPTLSRRRFTAALGSATVAALAAPSVSAANHPSIVIVGAGAGGATVARHLAASIGEKGEITVLAGASTLYRAPFLNTSLLLGEPVPAAVPLADHLNRIGVRAVFGTATSLDRRAKSISAELGNEKFELSYDLLVAAPGVAFRPFGAKGDDTDGKDACWMAGADCDSAVAALASLPKGGTLAIAAPPQPYRCPPAIYERACRFAQRFKTTDPTAKILIVDDKDSFPMQALFEAAFADYYEDMIEWIPRQFHGGITRLDFTTASIVTEDDTFEADVLHAVPPQTAPDFLINAQLGDDRGYCPIEAASMRAGEDPDIYIVGDAAAAGEMSKSAGSAVVQAELAARDIAARLTDRDLTALPAITDQCWSFLAPDDAVTLGGRYRPEGSRFVSTERFISGVEESGQVRQESARQAREWPGMMLEKIFGAAA